MKLFLHWDEIILQRTHFKFSVFIIFHSFFAVVQKKLFLICDFVISAFVMLGGSASRVSIDSSRGVEQS